MAASERLITQFQIAFNLSADLSQNFMLRLNSISKPEYNARTDL